MDQLEFSVSSSSADGKRTRFNEPEARAGLVDFFRLGRYLPAGIPSLDIQQVTTLFAERRVAVTMGGPWRINALRQSGLSAERLAEIGIASPPGPAYVGGTNIVIWQHTRHAREAFELVRALNTKATAVTYSQFSSFLPARMDVLSAPPYSTDPQYQAFVQAIKSGRTTSHHRLWSLLEEKVNAGLHEIWVEIMKQPDLDLEGVVMARLEPIRRRLDLTLNN